MGAVMVAKGESALLERTDLSRDRDVSALFSTHYAPMCRLAYVILGDAAVAEEIVMEAMLKTFSSWRRIRDLDRVDAYLRRTVVNLCRSRIRRKVVETRASGVLQGRAERAEPDWDPDRHDVQRTVWDAVKGLPERQRACVVLRYFEDLPEAEIAHVMDCSVGTVKSQLSKARAKLGRALDPTAVGGES
jgi:RNA polymerase sigma-70 factor (sigma-E family)